MTQFEYSAQNPAAPVAYASFSGMHTVVEMVFVAPHQERARELAGRTEEMVRDWERRFSRFDPSGELARINREAAGVDVAVDEEVYAVLEMCLAMRKATLGYFDIAADRGRRNDGPRYRMDPASRTVRFTEPGVRLDLGGFAKGYAADRVRWMLRQEGVRSALVNFGDSSVAAMGVHPCGDSWPVGVADPLRPGEAAYTARLEDSALSVSGNLGREHIVDPLTGQWAAGGGMICVEGCSPLVAEVLSTALCAAPMNRRGEILTNFEGYRAVHIGRGEDGKLNVFRIL